MMRDGPAKGFAPIMARAPILLRVVLDGLGGQDVLDMLEDEPREGETVHVYERVGNPAMVCGRGEGTSGWVAEYRHRDDVDGEELRETEAWRAWAMDEGNGRWWPPHGDRPKSRGAR
jgi:hypothetical protein